MRTALEKRALVFAAVAVLALIASVTLPAQSAPRREYERYLVDLRAAVLAGDADALGALVTEDRVSVSGASGKTMRGRAAQVESDRVVFRNSRVTAFDMTITDFQSSGSLAYATGTGTHRVIDKATGAERVDTFQYVEVLVLEKDGKWRSKHFMNAPREPGT